MSIYRPAKTSDQAIWAAMPSEPNATRLAGNIRCKTNDLKVRTQSHPYGLRLIDEIAMGTKRTTHLGEKTMHSQFQTRRAGIFRNAFAACAERLNFDKQLHVIKDQTSHRTVLYAPHTSLSAYQRRVPTAR